MHSGDGASATKVTRRARHQGSSGDLAWFSRGAFTAARTFYNDWQRKRYVDNRSGMPSTGTRICKFGMTTSATCSTVRTRDATITSADITYRHMVIMNGGGVRPGDSGGPWYYGGTAYGITHDYFAGSDRSSFTPAYLLQNLGVDVYQR